jgi:hypothetical protein
MRLEIRERTSTHDSYQEARMLHEERYYLAHRWTEVRSDRIRPKGYQGPIIIEE